jgi:hypothetical protein
VRDGFAGRFALETIFLILLAVAVGLADERPLVIVGVMAAGWVVVSVVELLAWVASRPRPAAPVEYEPAPEPAHELHGWDVAEIIAPQAPQPPPDVESTTALPPTPEERPRRRLFRSRRPEP